MAVKITVDIVDPGDETIKVSHIFWGKTEAEARVYYAEHLQSCDYFRAAEKDNRVIEEIEEIDEDELPEAEPNEEEPEAGPDGG